MIPLTRAIPERIRCGYDDALYKLTFTLLTLLYFPFGDRHPHVTHSFSGQDHSSSQTASRLVQPFCMGFKCYAVQCSVSGEVNLQNCSFPLEFRHPAEKDRATAVSNIHKNLVELKHVVRKISWRTDRHTHTDTVIIILRYDQLNTKRQPRH